MNNNYWNWGTGAVYPPRWGGYPGYGGRPGGINNGNINIGNDINIGGGSNVIGNSKPWSPDRDRYRAGQGTKPGLANTRARRPGRCRWTRKTWWHRRRGWPRRRRRNWRPRRCGRRAAGPAASVAQAGSADLAELAGLAVLQLAAQSAVRSEAPITRPGQSRPGLRCPAGRRPASQCGSRSPRTRPSTPAGLKRDPAAATAQRPAAAQRPRERRSVRLGATLRHPSARRARQPSAERIWAAVRRRSAIAARPAGNRWVAAEAQRPSGAAVLAARGGGGGGGMGGGGGRGGGGGGRGGGGGDDLETASASPEHQPSRSTCHDRPIRSRPNLGALHLAFIASSAATSCAAIVGLAQALPRRSAFPTPEAASKALIDAAKAGQPGFVDKIFGPGAAAPLVTGETPRRMRSSETAFNDAAAEAATLVPKGDTTRLLQIGKNAYLFPMPDREERRRLGLRPRGRAGSSSKTAASASTNSAPSRPATPTSRRRRNISAPTATTMKCSNMPIASSAARPTGRPVLATGEPGGQKPARRPFQRGGSVAQGRQAGALQRLYFPHPERAGRRRARRGLRYLINGRLLAGFALVAYPADWGHTGVMSFMCNQSGRVFQKNLGQRTAEIAGTMTRYNPDQSWSEVD